MFTLIAMTGLDQDMMQRSLSCRNVKDSQKTSSQAHCSRRGDFLFLVLGVLLYLFAGTYRIPEAAGDRLFPAVATSGLLPALCGILFVLGWCPVHTLPAAPHLQH